MTELSVVIPAHNEEGGIKPVLTKLQEVLKNKFNYEILVVDDGSTDRTAEAAASLGAKIIKNPSNIGYGASLKRGIEAAGNEYVVTVDADGTYPVEKIPELVSKLEQGFDMAVGARSGKHYWRGMWLNPARLILKWISEFAAGRKITDVNSGLRAIKRSKILPFFADLSNRFSFSTSITLVFLMKGYPVAYIPINYYARKGKSKVRYFRDGLKTLRTIFNLFVRYRLLKK